MVGVSTQHPEEHPTDEGTNKNNKNKPQEQPPPLDDTQPTPLPKHNRTHACYAAVIDFKPTGQTYSDQTGKFPVTSSSGNAYLFILYDYDSNAILAEPIKNRSAESILEAYKICHARLSKAGLKPKLHRLDNECSRILKEYMTEEAQVDYQIVPPGVHRRNAAERAIRTFKNHLIAGLCSTHPDFPMKLWDRLIPQAEITLNLLRGSRMNPKLSAYAQIHGPFDYNRTPLAPPGTRILVHEKSSSRGTWAPHAVDGWCVGPALEHYRCYTTHIWSTKAERITDTLEWFPHEVTMPTASSVDIIATATNDILKALKNPSKNSPLDPLTDSETTALQTAVEILHNKSNVNSDAPPPAIQPPKLPPAKK